MRAVPVSGALGAEIVDVDVRDLDDAGFEALRKLLHEHEVVFIRGVEFTDDEHIAFAERFGPLRLFPIAKLLGATEPTLQVIADGPDSPPEADDWHTDVTWVAEPPDYAVLRATVVPERGGDTLWASMTAAYEALSAPMRAFLDSLTVRHDNTVFIDAVERKAPDMCEQFDVPNRLRTEYPGVEHPLVRTHPDTGRKSLFLGGDFMREIVALRADESATLLDFLRRHIEDARYHCRWRWAVGDVAIWDERSTNHRSAGDHFPQHREIRRSEVGGARPR
ncbi:MAG TPA: TauD/TfdA family dioxygenase [Acidimicrobiia bacterium]|nr:TauD/TfdA family dioxygenase [Acidimicrobiia bacterium]